VYFARSVHFQPFSFISLTSNEHKNTDQATSLIISSNNKETLSHYGPLWKKPKNLSSSPQGG
jgi:hypothetical protein